MKKIENLKKKCISGILAACMVLGGSVIAVPSQVQAAVHWSPASGDNHPYPGSMEGFDDKNYVYVLPKNATKAKGATIIGYGGAAKSIKLPTKEYVLWESMSSPLQSHPVIRRLKHRHL